MTVDPDGTDGSDRPDGPEDAAEVERSEGAGPAQEPGARRPRRWRKVLRIAATIVVVGAVGVLFARTLASNWDAVLDADVQLDWRAIVATLAFTLAVPISGLLWGRIVDVLTRPRRVGVLAAMAVHSSSWLLKYIPGQVGSVMNKVLWGSRHGYPRSLMLIAFVYENVFLQIASIVPSAIVLVLAVGSTLVTSNLWTATLVLVALLPLVTVLSPRLFHAILDLISRRMLKRPLPEEYFLRPVASLGFSAAFIVPRIVNGAGFVLVVAMIADVAPGDWLPLAAAYALAGAIGILAILVPSGLGVREGVLYACLVGLGYDPAEAVIASVIARLLSTVADLGVAGIYAGLQLAIRRGRT